MRCPPRGVNFSRGGPSKNIFSLCIAPLPAHHGDSAMCCGFGVEARAMRKNRSSFRLAIFSSANQSSARIPHQSPVTSHYHHDGGAACFGFVQRSLAGRLTLRFAAEVVFRTLPERGIPKNIAVTQNCCSIRQVISHELPGLALFLMEQSIQISKGRTMIVVEHISLYRSSLRWALR